MTNGEIGRYFYNFRGSVAIATKGDSKDVYWDGF